MLIGVDDSAFSQTAAEEVARRLWPAGPEVKVISAVEPPFDPPTTGDDGRENHFKVARAAVDKATRALQQSGSALEITGAIVEGSPKHVIVEEAEEWRADLVVVGSHGRRGLDRFLLGSVSQAVALHAPCSVQIVRAPREKRSK
jgi:nucleotide-binding universal stress UspA family protein